VRSIDPALFPFRSNFFDRGAGLQMHYLDEGQGAPVLMVHGNPSWSFYYRNLVKALSGTRRCIVPDHIGMGLSDKPDDAAYSYTLKQRIDDLDALVSSLNLSEPVTLVVHDWGGMIGFGWAVRHPELVARIVILNTGAFPLPKEKALPKRLKLTRTALGAFLVRGFNAFSFAATKMGCTRNKMSPEISLAYRAPYDSWKNRIATLRFVQDIPLGPEDKGFDLVENVAANLHQFNSVPALIAWGGKDFVFDDAFLRQWRQYLPQAKVHVMADAGHYILEDAAEEVVPLVADFIRS
jgi:haloalkane dehalogenase